jgi:hypothetical protein
MFRLSFFAKYCKHTFPQASKTNQSRRRYALRSLNMYPNGRREARKLSKEELAERVGTIVAEI